MLGFRFMTLFVSKLQNKIFYSSFKKGILIKLIWGYSRTKCQKNVRKLQIENKCSAKKPSLSARNVNLRQRQILFYVHICMCFFFIWKMFWKARSQPYAYNLFNCKFWRQINAMILINLSLFLQDMQYFRKKTSNESHFLVRNIRKTKH